MYYPGLDGIKIDEISEEEVTLKISELNKRIGIAHKLGRTDIINQLNNLIEYYQTILKEKYQREEQKIIDADPKLGKSIIDIDWPDPNEEKEDEY